MLGGAAFPPGGPWRGAYFTHLKGGLRTPFLIRWPGKIPAGKVSNEIVHMVDTFSTFASIAGAKVPTDRLMEWIRPTFSWVVRPASTLQVVFSSGQNHDLAVGAICVHQFMRFAEFFKAKHRAHLQLEIARGNKLDVFLQLRRCNVA